ncbi:MAG TPA: AIR synthase-related protein, partial [Thermomicrobiales bacterium]|nr:AIR synthase-related protein [Thermomicrobiales bacterium]
PIRALANITGGGLPENAHRMLPDDCGLVIDAASWQLPPVFGWLAKAGGLTAHDLARALNCGIGMIAICAEEDAARLRTSLESMGETVYHIGTVVPAPK